MNMETSLIALNNPKEVWELIQTSKVLEKWYNYLDSLSVESIIGEKNFLLVLPCSSHKLPSYRQGKSDTYKLAYSLRFEDCMKLHIWTISEPLVIHPSDWKWVPDNEWEPIPGILPYYDVTGLFHNIDQYEKEYEDCCKFLGDKLRRFIDRSKTTIFIFVVRPWMSHGDILKYAFNWDKINDITYDNRVFICGCNCNTNKEEIGNTGSKFLEKYIVLIKATYNFYFYNDPFLEAKRKDRWEGRLKEYLSTLSKEQLSQLKDKLERNGNIR